MLESYTRQWIDEGDIEAVAEVLKSASITRGPSLEAFEMAIAEYCGALHGVAFNSGTSALHGAYFAADVNQYDHLITSPNTFVGTVAGALVRGAMLQLTDIDGKTGSMDLKQLQLNPSSRGRNVIVPIHFGGAPIDMADLEASISEPDAVVIEDGCHALGATYTNGKRVGNCEWSAMTIFSFHPTKIITSGEGGMVLTNDATLARRLRLFRNNGGGELISGNFHLTEMQAALGLSQLRKLPTILRKRRQLVKTYRAHLEGVEMLSDALDAESAHHFFVILVDDRDAIQKKLEEQGIGTQIHYKPLYRHPAISHPPLPNMEAYCARALSLPLHPQMTSAHVKTVCEALR